MAKLVESTPAEPKGWLIIGIEEAHASTPKEPMTWDTASNGGLPFEPFVKVELRGGPRSVKAQTRKASLNGDTVVWQEQLRLEVLEGSNELRLMVCREKFSNGRKGTAVVAACGIFVADILDAVPLQKYFQLFRPSPGGDGGYILISMNYVTDLSQLDAAGAAIKPKEAAGASTGAKVGSADAAGAKKKGGKVGKILGLVGGLLLLGAAGTVTGLLVAGKGKKSSKAATPAAKGAPAKPVASKQSAPAAAPAKKK